MEEIGSRMRNRRATEDACDGDMSLLGGTMFVLFVTDMLPVGAAGS